ncbi:VOC family protein [Acaryochloris sp. CCMEE 5410]|uniref:VOC family protein n=1 Tax=Acaryochloris sp. CCMEE 5410 TaxID=310037 RepID=UPI000248411F|nr:VOC family protein [Acaryochloris sp. CCMEE 5410]KAI9135336.1 VOC family protein [Acaryochloris sp. CCMEE 5410]
MANPWEQHGTFSWCELMTTDTDAAQTFYAQLFGWEMQDQPMPGMMYTVLQSNGKEVGGGLMPIPDEAAGCPPTWGIYVTVDDVDATAKTTTELGGTVMRLPTDIPNVGRFAIIQDPQGAMLSIISYFPKPS